MRLFLRVWLIILVCAVGVANGQSSTDTAIDAKLWNLKEKIEAQLEKIKLAKMEAQSAMDLSKLRLEEQSRRWEEKLLLQIEKLNQYQESMKEQLDETSKALAQANSDLNSLVSTMNSEVNDQIFGANNLISKLRKARNKITGESADSEDLFDVPAQSSSKPASSMKRIYLTPAKSSIANIGESESTGDCTGEADMSTIAQTNVQSNPSTDQTHETSDPKEQEPIKNPKPT